MLSVRFWRSSDRIMFQISPELMQLIQFTAYLAAGLAFIFTMRGEIKAVKTDLGHLRDGQKALTEAFTQLGKVLTQVAVQDVRINMLEKKVDEIAHGEGLVGVKK